MDAALRRDHAGERQAERRLARAGFADDAERLAGAHGDVDAVHRLHVIDDRTEEPLLDREPDFYVLARHHRLGGPIRGGRFALRLGSEQMARVFVLRVGEDVLRRADLDDLALGHDADAVGDLAHDAEIVGYE